MRIVQIFPVFQMFYLPNFFSSGYGHRHISGSLNFILNIFQIFFVRPFSSMLITCMLSTGPDKLLKPVIMGR